MNYSNMMKTYIILSFFNLRVENVKSEIMKDIEMKSELLKWKAPEENQRFKSEIIKRKKNFDIEAYIGNDEDKDGK